MKIAVFSDSHKKTRGIDNALKKVGGFIDAVIHLGDGCEDTENYEYIYPNLAFYRVCGNCDFVRRNVLSEQMIELSGKRIFITHGHMYGVKSGYDRIISAAKEKSADICMFGHTHRGDIFYNGNMLFINPGSATFSGEMGLPTYGMIDIIGDDVVGNLVCIYSGLL